MTKKNYFIDTQSMPQNTDNSEEFFKTYLLLKSLNSRTSHFSRQSCGGRCKGILI